MKRLARINGNVTAIITGDEIDNCKNVEGKLFYPVTFFGVDELVSVIVQNGKHFFLTVGESYNHLEGWKI